MMKPLSQLDPALQELCGICHVDENDLNGDGARKMMINYAAIPVMNASEYIATTNIE